MPNFRLYTFRHRSSNHSGHFQYIQSRPQVILCHFWGEYLERCSFYRYVRVSLLSSLPTLSPPPIETQELIIRTLSRFHGENIYLSSLFHGVGIFLFTFFGSMLLGVLFGLGCSLGLKHSHLASFPHIESCLVALVAYTSYFFSNGMSMSGESALLYPA